MRLFQYWDTGHPPDEVAEWIEGFRVGNPELKHSLYDRDSASWLIRKHFGEREQRAFEAIAVPSMQSDYFRYCAVEAFGGVYADADYLPREPLTALINQAPHSLLLMWRGHWVGGLMMFKRPQSPFVRACRDLTTLNIEARRFGTAYTAAGPGVINAIRLLHDPSAEEEILAGFDNRYGRTWQFPELLEAARSSVQLTPELKSDIDRITILHHLEVERWLASPRPAYKNGPLHWLDWNGSIYR